MEGGREGRENGEVDRLEMEEGVQAWEGVRELNRMRVEYGGGRT